MAKINIRIGFININEHDVNQHRPVISEAITEFLAQEELGKVSHQGEELTSFVYIRGLGAALIYRNIEDDNCIYVQLLHRV